jgi:acylpyruvate hydrolase
MRLVTFSLGNVTHMGVLLEEQIIDLPGAYADWRQANPGADLHSGNQQGFPENVLAFLQAGDAAKALATEVLADAASQDHFAQPGRSRVVYAIDEVTLLPPIQRPGKIICLGHNYRRHIAEMGSPMPQYPVIFAKFANTLIGHRQPIVLPRVSQMVDYEAELALVIGRRGKDIPATAAAFDYLAGYTIFNDVSVRDYQRRTVQWLQGKTFDGSGPIGPAIVTTDEIQNPNAFEVTLRVNGEVMQHATTDDFIFPIPTILSYLSEIMTLEPGDIIATGTPSGVGFARQPPVFLKPGDVVQIEISELGLLENPVVASPGA